MVARRRGGLSATPDVVVVGAGPTGLTAALQAHAHGATVRVVERRPELRRPSRAMIMHPRTLECLRPLGVTDSLLERGDRAPEAELHLGKRRVATQLADVALPDTAFPHLTVIRQMDVEEVLADALERRGIEVERDVELLHVEPGREAAQVVLRHPRQVEELNCRFVAGCDGPDSTVRRDAAIRWQGAAYREEVVLADLELDGNLAPGLLHVFAGRAGLVFLFALGEDATWRMLATRPAQTGDGGFGQPGPAVSEHEVQRILDSAKLGVRVDELTWSARVPLQHRLATTFRDGPIFLAGDAAHAHSPAAAQGMNNGILDAVNLGWKLAFAAGGGHPDLLDSYTQERRPVARQVLALTHLVFFAEASLNPLPACLRGTLMPMLAPVLPHLLSQRWLTAGVVRMLSQGWVHYRHSAISVQGAPEGDGPRPGDRLPDEAVTCDGKRTTLHQVTAEPGVHLLLERDASEPDEASLGPRVTTHRVSTWPGRGVLAIRPDGHVGFRCGTVEAGQLGAWLDLVGVGSQTPTP